MSFKVSKGKKNTEILKWWRDPALDRPKPLLQSSTCLGHNKRQAYILSLASEHTLLPCFLTLTRTIIYRMILTFYSVCHESNQLKLSATCFLSNRPFLYQQSSFCNQISPPLPVIAFSIWCEPGVTLGFILYKVTMWWMDLYSVYKRILRVPWVLALHGIKL